MKLKYWDALYDAGNRDRLHAFLEQDNGYAIMQLKPVDETTPQRFVVYSWLEQQGKTPQLGHYQVVYTGALPEYPDREALLEDLYTEFNVARPDDFTGHSLSVSDVVVLRENGVTSCHYVDNIGFQDITAVFGLSQAKPYITNCVERTATHYVFGDYVLTGVPNAFNEKTSFWISKKYYARAFYCFSISNPAELEYQLQHIDTYINMINGSLGVAHP